MKNNILFIMSDQHRYDCIGAYGNKDVKTKNLDNLANDGVLHTRHYCTYPVCTPSRYSLLSGLYTHQHMGWSNHCTLPSGIDTYPKLLKQIGYNTAVVGKMHSTPTYLDVGFDEMFLAEQDGDGRFDDDYHKYLMENNLIDINDIVDQRQEYREKAKEEYWDTYGAQKSNLDEKHHSTTWITDKALEEIENWTDEGNMMLVSYVKPHHPFDPPAPYDTMYNPDELTLLDGYTNEVSDVDYEHHKGYFDHKNLTEKRLRRIMAHYYGSITQIDDNIGRIIDLLKEKGLYDNTLIIYTSDHGDYMGYHHMMLKSNYMYEPLAKVPLIIKYPNNKHSGVINNNLSSNIDIAPTILNYVNAKIPYSMKGMDLENQQNAREFSICEGLRNEIVDGKEEFYCEYMVVSDRYKLIVGKNLENCRFFDLQNDPLELCDVSKEDKYKSEIEKHKKYLVQTITFDSLSPIYLNYEEKQNNINNKIPRNDVKQYYIDKFNKEF